MPRTSKDSSSVRARPTVADLDLGHFAAIALCAGVGLLICSTANTLSRATLGPASLLYWLGLLLIALPIFYRLSSPKPSFGERFGLVAVLALALYGVKVVRDSLVFNFSDEAIHTFNAAQIATHHHLFHSNPILPATANYPGLEGATSALMSLTGASSFGAGILLIGAARLAFLAALFLLFSRLSGSPRVAGLGVAIYTGSSNFLFWGAQFSYESLALPLLVVVLLAVVEREVAPRASRNAWSITIFLGILAVVVTHHLTSYALTFILISLAILYRTMRAEGPNPWPFAVSAFTAAALWLLLVASSTFGYIFPVLKSAFLATINTASGEEAPRTLFHTSSTDIGGTPLLARAVALTAVALLAAGFAYGIRAVWRKHRRQPMVIVLGVMGLGFFATLALRFAPAAWETGNRAGEFLFLGLSFVVAYGALRMLGTGEPSWRRRAALAAALGVVLTGGVISGWPWDAQLAQPLRASAEGREIVSEPLALGNWVKERLPTGRFAAPSADARLILDPGGAEAVAGTNPPVQDILAAPAFSGWELPLLREQRLRYVVADRREVSEDAVRGYYFRVPGRNDTQLRPKATGYKFAKLPAGRVYDSGSIAVYDLADRP
jgi:hypothetical protein